MIPVTTLLLMAVTLPVGFLSAYFTYSIYRKTRGGSKGWEHFMITGLILGVFSISATLFTLMGIPPYQNPLKLWVDIMCFFVLSFIFPLAGLMLARDMGVKALSPKVFLVCMSAILTALLAYSFLVPNPGFTPVMVSVLSFMMVFGFPFLAYASYRLGFRQGLMPWKIIMVASFVMILATLSEVAITDACGGWDYNAVLAGNSPGVVQACADYPSDIVFAPVLPTGGAFASLMPIAKYNDIYYLLGALMFIFSFFLIWRSMRVQVKA